MYGIGCRGHDDKIVFISFLQKLSVLEEWSVMVIF